MLKLINLSTHPLDLGKFGPDNGAVGEFLRKHRMDGLEIIQNPVWNPETVPAQLIKGLHLNFWPMWLEFWRNDTAELNRLFESRAAWEEFYGGRDSSTLVRHYRNEIETACRMGARYVVFHVAHVQPEHCFNYKFTYNSSEVIDASIQLLNEVLEGIEPGFELLFENLWWPGLTLLSSTEAERLMAGVNYPLKGFMLDTSHLMNTNRRLENEEEAVEYILDVLGNLGSISKYIRGIHLNSSLSGKYVDDQLQKPVDFTPEDSFIQRYLKAYRHILRIDWHTPFKSTAVRRIIEYVKPEYLVYEFLCERLEVLDEYLSIQNSVLDL